MKFCWTQNTGVCKQDKFWPSNKNKIYNDIKMKYLEQQQHSFGWSKHQNKMVMWQMSCEYWQYHSSNEVWQPHPQWCMIMWFNSVGLHRKNEKEFFNYICIGINTGKFPLIKIGLGIKMSGYDSKYDLQILWLYNVFCCCNPINTVLNFTGNKYF